jgi:hypothetical protein
MPPGSAVASLSQGLAVSAVALALVFAALTLLWGGIVLLMRLFPGAESHPVLLPGTLPGPAHVALEEELAAERAEVAAIVAGALLSNALPIHFEPPTGPLFEHGRTAPSWVLANRARALESWQPARGGEADGGFGTD